MRFTAIVVASLVLASIASAQTCPLAPPNATPTRPDTPWFDFQVDKPGRFIATDTSGSYPDESFTARKPVTSPDLFLIQFVIDSMGVPNTKSLKVLKTPFNVTTDSVKVIAEHWRYTPAIARGCKVAQLVQTPLRWR